MSINRRTMAEVEELAEAADEVVSSAGWIAGGLKEFVDAYRYNVKWRLSKPNTADYDWPDWSLQLIELGTQSLRDAIGKLAFLIGNNEAVDCLRLASPEPAVIGDLPPQLSYMECAASLADRIVYHIVKPSFDPFPAAFVRPPHGWLKLIRERTDITFTLPEPPDLIVDQQQLLAFYRVLSSGQSASQSYDFVRVSIAKECQKAVGRVPHYYIRDENTGTEDPSTRLAMSTRRAIDLFKQGKKPAIVAEQVGLTASNARQIKRRAKMNGLLDS